jgi:hypothetical protein
MVKRSRTNKTPASYQIERNANPVDFERASFVVKALSKESYRPFLCVVHVEEGKTGCRIVASDGHRLHTAELTLNIKSGDYKPLVSKDVIVLAPPDETVNFPDWQRVVPDDSKKRGVLDFSESGFGKNEKQTAKMAVVSNALFKATGETVNLRYLEDLPKKAWVVYSQEEKGRAMVFKEKGAENAVYAVIMPLCPDDVASAMAA